MKKYLYQFNSATKIYVIVVILLILSIIRLVNLSILATILCVVVPIERNTYLYHKEQVDFYYSLPIKRVRFTIERFISGIIILITIFITLHFIQFILYSDLILETPFFPLLFLSLFIYSINYFMASRATNKLNSYLLIFLVSFFPGLLINVISAKHIYPNIYRDQLATNNLVYLFRYGIYHFGTIDIFGIQETIIIILGVISFGLLLLFTKYDKAERSEQLAKPVSFLSFLISYIFISLGLAVVYSFAENINPFVIFYLIFLFTFRITLICIINKQIKIPQIYFLVSEIIIVVFIFLIR